MRRVNFDLDVLRSFVTGMDLGSYARAADRLGRSTSAVSAQMKKLEEQAGTAIFRKSGRNLALTDAGQTMLSYARRLLDLNDEAATALHGADLEGWVRLGLQEDFGEALLPAILGQFARAHPKVRIEARVGRNADLIERIEKGQIDLALTWGQPGMDRASAPYIARIAEVPMCWITAAGQDGGAFLAPDDVGARQMNLGDDPLPLVAFEPPCLLRDCATTALDRAGVAWRMAFVSPSLGGLWAATAAGLGVMVRTPIGLPANLRVIDGGLPALPSLDLNLLGSESEPSDIVQRLADILMGSVRDAMPGYLERLNAA
ncbi:MULTISPECIES: LysR substrate-binding domain-containing protein [Thalassospira]|uniref:LysR substrate-binding domain-containing protein n=1 Tax=Thalassospira TaxID=168934 RepID=UPI0008DE09C7|nr:MULTISPECIES: LysR substrate-binding domain-containing protein [Thalassospira]MAB33254.1 LysR family transcriptional regulator [Thalassospira sp.]MDM7977000.1 LysR substrate-binding domain-containing protein [Thalassospira xiamenensis]OHY99354.1 LysR family transcriptional regulator [Thalassospira sp. MIT1004]HBS23460.1 LysR family transcriptional regulator [Thalassospira sp.]